MTQEYFLDWHYWLLVAKASSLIPIQAYNSIIMDIEILLCLDIAVTIASCDQTGAKASDDCGEKMTPGHWLRASSPH